MNSELVRKLIEKGVIHENTEIDAYYNGVDIGGANLARVKGNFSIRTAKVVQGEIIFETISTQDGSARRIKCSEVVGIDGMSPDRFAANYGMTEMGDTVKQGKRRGRKPKVRDAA